MTITILKYLTYLIKSSVIKPWRSKEQFFSVFLFVHFGWQKKTSNKWKETNKKGILIVSALGSPGLNANFSKKFLGYFKSFDK